MVNNDKREKTVTPERIVSTGCRFPHSITKQTTPYKKYCSEVGFLKNAHIACFDPDTKTEKTTKSHENTVQ